MPGPLSPELLQNMHVYWRAANYLSVGQIYLQDNALLEAPLAIEHIKPRLLGHWGTTPGLNFLYVHLNRLIKENDLNMMYVIGPGHGGPGIVAPDVPGSIHVRGYNEEGTTTTPFDMFVLNKLDRYQLALDAIRRIPHLGSG